MEEETFSVIDKKIQDPEVECWFDDKTKMICIKLRWVHHPIEDPKRYIKRGFMFKVDEDSIPLVREGMNFPQFTLISPDKIGD